MAPKRLARVRELLKDRSFHKEFPGGGQMNHGSMNRLKPEQWLDDECINSYGFMMQQRADQHVAQKKSNKGMNGTAAAHDSSKVLDMHYFNSFWYEKVKTHGHDGVRRWTKKASRRNTVHGALVLTVALGGSVLQGCGGLPHQPRQYALGGRSDQHAAEAYRVLRLDG